MSNKTYDVKVDAVHFYDDGISLEWYGAIGFGEIRIERDFSGDIVIDSECMTKEFVKAALNDLVDKAILK